MKPQEKFVGFDTLKRNVSMVQILERYGLKERLHRNGDNLSGACPIHGGHNQTQFRVSLSKNCWICFGDCHAGGSIVDFVSRKERIGIRDAALLIQEWFNVRADGVPRAVQAAKLTGEKAVQRAAEPDWNPPLSFSLKALDRTHPYLNQRGLAEETIRMFGVGHCRTGMFAGWIAIPIHDAKGQLVAYAGRWPGEPRNGEPKYRLPKGFRKSLELFNLDRAKKEDARLPLVVVEGFFGCMHVWQAGYRRVVSLMGSMLSNAQEQLIVRTAGPGGRVILLFDEDEAGRKGSREAQGRLETLLEVRNASVGQEGGQPDGLSSERLIELLNQ
jgi:DNA primase